MDRDNDEARGPTPRTRFEIFQDEPTMEFFELQRLVSKLCNIWMALATDDCGSPMLGKVVS